MNVEKGAKTFSNITEAKVFFYLACQVSSKIQPVKTYYRGKHTIKQISLIMQPIQLTNTQEYTYCSSLAAKLLFNGFVVVSSHATPIDLLQLNVMHHCKSIFTGSNCVVSETLKNVMRCIRKIEWSEFMFFVCLFLELIVPLENFSLIWRRHHYR